MESQIKSSFIPNQVPNQLGRSPKLPRSGDALDIILLIAIVGFAAALALSAGVFLYHKFLTTSVENKSTQLDRARAAFEPELIAELVRLDSRLTAADRVLNQHLAPSLLFTLLEDITLESVEFSSLEYMVEADNSIRMNVVGKAKSVNGVALQSSLFGRHNAIQNPLFSDLNLVSDGVTFSVATDIDPAALRYTELIRGITNEVLPSTTIEDVQRSGVPEDNFGDFGPASEEETF